MLKWAVFPKPPEFRKRIVVSKISNPCQFYPVFLYLIRYAHITTVYLLLETKPVSKADDRKRFFHLLCQSCRPEIDPEMISLQKTAKQ